jgi:hypothetical protein
MNKPVLAPVVAPNAPKGIYKGAKSAQIKKMSIESECRQYAGSRQAVSRQ